MPQFAPSQIAVLNDLYASAGASTIPGEWIVGGSLSFTELDSAVNAALNQGVLAYGWGDHALVGYATGLQGTHADTAYGWGNHASAGYLTSAPIFKKTVTVATAGQTVFTLSPTRNASSSVLAFKDTTILVEGVGYLVSGSTITVSPAASGGETYQFYYDA